jgi:hypothetical protein
VLGVKGVAYDAENTNYPYRSRITRNGITIMLGSYKTASEAHQAYCDAANRVHGRFNPASSLYQCDGLHSNPSDVDFASRSQRPTELAE